MQGEPTGRDAGPSTAPPAPGAAPAVDRTPDPPAGLEWRRFHPVTPAVKGWKVLLVVLAIATQQVTSDVSNARDLYDAVGWAPVVGVLALITAIGFGYAALAWRMTRYAVDAEAVYLQTGVLFRQQRSARLDRIQAIDVVQPVLARIMGLAELKVEVAGGSDSAVRLAFLKEDHAQEVRNELLARAAGVSFGTADQPAPPAAPEHEVLAVPPGRLVHSLVRSAASYGALVSVVVVVGIIVATREVGAALGLAPVAFGAVGYLWQRFAGEFNFRAAQSPDGIRLRRGLLETRAQTLPPGRVQAVRLTQPLLWRGKDWWRVQVNVAGYVQSSDGSESTETVLLPVGDRDEALTALWLVLPDLGVADPRAVLDHALVGDGDAGGFVTSPRRARLLDPLSWRRNGFVVTDRALLARSGRIIRRLVVVPHERTQSLGLSQGPLQRRLDVVSFALHSVPGPVTPQVAHLDATVGRDLLGEQAHRARTARAAAGPEQWMTALARSAAAPGDATQVAVPQEHAPHGAVPQEESLPPDLTRDVPQARPGGQVPPS